LFETELSWKFKAKVKPKKNTTSREEKVEVKFLASPKGKGRENKGRTKNDKITDNEPNVEVLV
jgi:hypothetical protein